MFTGIIEKIGKVHSIDRKGDSSVIGLPALYLVTVAAASTLLRRRQLSTLVAAITALAILADSTWDPEPPLPRDRYGPVCAR